MQNNTPAPINDSTGLSEEVLGENLSLLVLHKAFNELTEKEDEAEKEKEAE